MPRSFVIDPIVYDNERIVDTANVKITNADDVLTASFVGGTPRGSDFKIETVVLDSDYAIIGTPITLFDGEIDKWNFKEPDLFLTITSIFYNWKRKTLNKQMTNCRWKKFKGTECGYVGSATWCDRSYTRCTSLANTSNYGGEKFLASIADKVLWWGRKPKN